MDASNIIGREEQEITESGPWGDLPQDILVSIHNKLHFVEQVRFRAVCENWRIPKDFIRCPDNLPWILVKFSWRNSTAETNRYPFECRFFDPYSQKTYSVSNYIEDPKNLNNPSDQRTLYASKYGWSLFGLTGHSSLLFLHNPFINEVIMLPHLDFICKTATFTANPTSPECEILVLCRPYKLGESRHSLYVGRCRLSNREWTMKFLERIVEEPLSVCYMKGELYCVFYEAQLRSYNLTTESWEAITERLPSPYIYHGYGTYWLTERENDLLLVWIRTFNETRMWSILKMDWSTKSWSMERNLGSVAFFISGKISLATTLEDGNGESMRASMKIVNVVSYEDHYCREVKCYFLQKVRKLQLKDDSSCIRNLTYGFSFIEPPYVSH